MSSRLTSITKSFESDTLLLDVSDAIEEYNALIVSETGFLPQEYYGFMGTPEELIVHATSLIRPELEYPVYGFGGVNQLPRDLFIATIKSYLAELIIGEFHHSPANIQRLDLCGNLLTIGLVGQKYDNVMEPY